MSALGFEIPERAIKRVAGRARRHRTLQREAIKTRIELWPHGIDLGHNAIDALAITGIGDAFAATAGLAIAEFGDDDDCFDLAAPTDAKGAGNGPAFDGVSK